MVRLTSGLSRHTFDVVIVGSNPTRTTKSNLKNEFDSFII